MAIQLPNAGLGDGKTGDNEFVMWTKVKDNFSDQTNAASRILGTGAEQVPLSKNIPSLLGTAATKDAGTEAGNLMQVGAFGFGTSQSPYNYNNYSSRESFMSDFAANKGNARKTHLANFNNDGSIGYPTGLVVNTSGNTSFAIVAGQYSTSRNPRLMVFTGMTGESAEYRHGAILASGITAFADSNGVWKTSSPVVRVYVNEIDPNGDAEKQGVTFTRNGVGDYMLHNTLGLAQEGWTITLPEDNNRNPLVAIETEELENGDLNIRTYKRIFSMETFTFTCDYDNPLDIPEGRCIDIRLHEIPVEMPDDIQTEV